MMGTGEYPSLIVRDLIGELVEQRGEGVEGAVEDEQCWPLRVR